MPVTNAPPRIKEPDEERYWNSPPPELSPRCRWWVDRIVRDQWCGNRRIAAMGYHESACYFGVYIWEYLHVLSPLLEERRRENRILAGKEGRQ